MNKIFLVIVVLLTINCKSQTNIIDLHHRCNHTNYNSTDGSTYLKDISNIYLPYTGTWKWTEGNKEMILILLKQIKYNIITSPFNFYEDRLVGYYIYKENGLTLIDTSNDNLNKDFGLNVSFNTSCSSTNVFTNFFQDIFRGISYEVKLEKLSSTQMKFTGKIGENTYYRPRTGTIYYQSGTTFPLDMIFTKQ
ncbi:DUF6705 family protein [Chryseobacterium taihuense]|uniref:DUF6705 domain-containing protein n=1 Tax=Chryseobacterium taihuense TaxID=1141221 RepID=A0ABY0R2V3_9FLAO|nr:DUF6705 family protein [Chryseobacterium taihuense]SDM33906.1 hypothetical protein SAMN05216273_1247 [Chryseobacterium taihuense]